MTMKITTQTFVGSNHNEPDVLILDPIFTNDPRFTFNVDPYLSEAEKVVWFIRNHFCDKTLRTIKELL